MGAVFPFLIPIGSERLPAFCTGKFIDRFLPDPLRMFRPPFFPAGFAAEHLLFHLRPLLYLHAAFAASVFTICCQDVRRGEAVPAAEALDGIPWDAKLLPYVCIAAPHAAETDDLFFLFIRHCQHLLTIRRFGGRFEGV